MLSRIIPPNILDTPIPSSTSSTWHHLLHQHLLHQQLVFRQSAHTRSFVLMKRRGPARLLGLLPAISRNRWVLVTFYSPQSSLSIRLNISSVLCLIFIFVCQMSLCQDVPLVRVALVPVLLFLLSATHYFLLLVRVGLVPVLVGPFVIAWCVYLFKTWCTISPLFSPRF